MELTEKQIYETYTACIGGDVSFNTMEKEVYKFLKNEGLTYEEIKNEVNKYHEG